MNQQVTHACALLVCAKTSVENAFSMKDLLTFDCDIHARTHARTHEYVGNRREALCQLFTALDVLLLLASLA